MCGYLVKRDLLNVDNETDESFYFPSSKYTCRMIISVCRIPLWFKMKIYIYCFNYALKWAEQ